jgi:type IV secretory pathway VirB10-like protein
MSWKGQNYSINAIALDPETYRSGLADSVDNHTFERYSKLAIASFVDGYADALQDTQTVTNTDGSSSTQTNALPDAADQMKMGIGKMGEKFSPIFEREFDRPPTVTVEANKSIIVMFMATVDLSKTK